MAKVVVKSKAKKAKRKFPVEIIAPEFLNSASLGTSQVSDLANFVGKSLKINLMYVSGSVKNQNVWLTFRVIEASSGQAKTEVKKYEQIPYYLGRFVKKGSDLVEDSFIAKSKDGKEVRVKPFVVTKENVSELVLSSVRAKTKESIVSELSKVTYDEFVSGVIGNKYQTQFRNEVKKIFPLKSFEFKKIELIK
ncbi:MAG: hypothetical protein ACOCXG_04530 [Nanoarchaeota archaeon]